MSSDVAISSVGPRTGEWDASTTGPSPPPAPVAVEPSPGVPNPTLRLDPALGLVVIEFVGKSDQVLSSIPTQQQLEAYRIGTATPPGEHTRSATSRTTHTT